MGDYHVIYALIRGNMIKYHTERLLIQFGKENLPFNAIFTHSKDVRFLRIFGYLLDINIAKTS